MEVGEGKGEDEVGESQQAFHLNQARSLTPWGSSAQARALSRRCPPA